MISAVRKRTLSNNSNIDFEKLSEIEMPEILCNKPEKVIVTQPTPPSCLERIPARYVLTFLTFLGLGIQYTQRVNLSVTIVAMVNSSFIEGNENDTTADECPNLYAVKPQLLPNSSAYRVPREYEEV